MTRETDAVLLRAVESAVGAPAGSVELLTRREGRLVARTTAAHPGPALVVKVSARASDFADEARAVSVLREAGLPVARVRGLVDGPPAVIAFDWTPGRAVSADDGVAVRRQVVDLLRRVHELPAQAPYGGTNPDLVTWVDGWTEHALAWWAAQEGVTGVDADRASSWYRAVRPLVEGRAGSLVLLDGRPEHFLVGDDEVVRMIDVTDLQPGDPVMDLALLQLHAPGLLDGVLVDHRQSEVRAAHLDELLPFFVFLRALAAAEWHAVVLRDVGGGAVWLLRAATELRAVAV